MPGPEKNFKLTNITTHKKQPLPGATPLHLYLPLPAALRSFATSPAVSSFPNLYSLRLYCFGALLGRVLKTGKRKFELVGQAQEAEVLVLGDPLMTLDPGLPVSDACLVLKLESVLFKSEGNQEALQIVQNYSLDEILYLSYGTPYRSALIFSEAALDNARAALERLHDYVERFALEARKSGSVGSKKAELDNWRERFYSQLYDDLNVPSALAVIWLMLQSNLGAQDKLGLLGEFDRILGLRLVESAPVVAAPEEIHSGNGYAAASKAEKSKAPAKTEKTGKDKTKGHDKTHPAEDPRSIVNPKDKPAKGKLITGVEGQSGTKSKAKNQPGQGQKGGQKAPAKSVEPPAPRRRIESTRQVRSFLTESDRFDFTVSLLAHNNLAELRPTIESLLFYTTRGARRIEVVAVDLGSQDGSIEYLDGIAASYANFRVMLASSSLGEAAGRNLALRQGRGRYLVLLDAGLTLAGDLFEPLLKTVSKYERPALFGLYPLRLVRGPQNEVTGFEPQSLPKDATKELVPVEALEGSLLCLRRAAIDEAGFMDEHFKIPYALDLDYSFAFRDKGFEVFALPGLSRFVNKPAGFSRSTYSLTPEELERQRQKNFATFKKSWNL